MYSKCCLPLYLTSDCYALLSDSLFSLHYSYSFSAETLSDVWTAVLGANHSSEFCKRGEPLSAVSSGYYNTVLESRASAVVSWSESIGTVCRGVSRSSTNPSVRLLVIGLRGLRSKVPPALLESCRSVKAADVCKELSSNGTEATTLCSLACEELNNSAL